MRLERVYCSVGYNAVLCKIDGLIALIRGSLARLLSI